MTSAFLIGPFRIAPHVRDGKPTGGWLVNVPKGMLGKRKRVFFQTRKAAEEYARDLDQQYRTGKWDGVRTQIASSAQSRASGIGLEPAIERWAEFQEVRVATHKKRKVSLYTDRGRLKAALAFFGDIDLSEITDEKLARFQAHRLNLQKRRPATIKSDLIALGKVLRWALRNGFISRLPAIEHIPEPRKEPFAPARDEVARIIRALPERLRPLVRFLAETGCRSGEAFNLTWDCVDELSGAIDIRSNERWTPKTRSSQRRIYISGPLLDEVRKLAKAGRYVFAGADPDRPINNIRKAFASAVKAAGITRNGKPARVTPHTLRKAYATWAAMELKIPQRLLQDLLGHTPGSRVTDQYYVMPLEDAKRQVRVSLPL